MEEIPRGSGAGDPGAGCGSPVEPGFQALSHRTGVEVEERQRRAGHPCCRRTAGAERHRACTQGPLRRQTLFPGEYDRLGLPVLRETAGLGGGQSITCSRPIYWSRSTSPHTPAALSHTWQTISGRFQGPASRCFTSCRLSLLGTGTTATSSMQPSVPSARGWWRRGAPPTRRRPAIFS